MAAPAVSLEKVTRRYGATVALDEVTLDVQRGEMFGLIGPDGAGKTTTIRLMAGLLGATSGTLRTLGLHPVREHRALTRRVGYLSQRFSLYGDLSVDENIAFFAEIHGVWRFHERRQRLLDLTQLTPFRSRLTDRLSGGMKQKLALACTLVHEPDLILLDEPTTGVDPVSRREFWKLLSEFLQQGLTIVMATPYLDEAERCSRVALLHDGHLMALDDPNALRAGYRGEIFEVVGSPHDRVDAVLLALDGVEHVQTFGERMHLQVRDRRGDEAVGWLAHELESAGCTDVQVRVVHASLEDLFIDLLAQERASATVAEGTRPAGASSIDAAV
jgi:ABC-2 type transport system ATP-binding protein